MATQIMC